MLAQASATGTAGQWVDVFWPPVNITPATTYYLVFTGNTSLGIAGDTANPYPYGQVFAGIGYISFPNFDYAFRTYFEACGMDADCTDDVFCNGDEQCEAGVCVSGVEPCLEDEICKEDSDECQNQWDLDEDNDVDKEDANLLKLPQKEEKTALKEKRTSRKSGDEGCATVKRASGYQPITTQAGSAHGPAFFCAHARCNETHSQLSACGQTTLREQRPTNSKAIICHNVL